MNRQEKLEALEDELALLVDGDAGAIARHEALLSSDDQARDLRHDANEVAGQIRAAGDDFVPSADLDALVLEQLRSRKASANVAPVARMPSSHRSESKAAMSGKTIALVAALSGGIVVAVAAAIVIAVWPASNESSSATTSAPPTGGSTGRVVELAGENTRGLSIADANGRWTPADANTAFGPGSTVRTDERTRARLLLNDGSSLTLNHSTELAFDGDHARQFTLRSGEVLADIATVENGTRAKFSLPQGTAEVLGTKFTIVSGEDRSTVKVVHGVVRVASSRGEERELHQGAEGILHRNGTLELAPIMSLARSLDWSELHLDPEEQSESALAGLGSLRAKRPGEREARDRPMRIARHDVRVRISGNVARTEIEEVFRNDSDETLEGIYRFPLPADAQIARLALDVDGQLIEGSFVAKERAARIWRGVIRNATPEQERRPTEEFIWVPGPWRDPALLEWQRGGQFELRIFPVPAHGERRVVLAYTQHVQAAASGRRYVYPLAHSNDGSTSVDAMSFDVRILDAQTATSRGYALTHNDEADAKRLSFSAERFTPNGDLIVDYALGGEERWLSAWSYRGEAASAPPAQSRDQDREAIDAQRALAADSRGYVAFALRPRMPESGTREPHDHVFLLDSSQSMVGERWERATRLARAVIAELDPRDRFTVLACDLDCRSLDGAAASARLRAPIPVEANAAADWLERIEPAGASNVVAAVRAATRLLGSDASRARQVLYFGDGVATLGARSPSALASEIGRATQSQGVIVTTIGIGADSDARALSAIARAAGGHYVPFVPGERLSSAALSVLETTFGSSLKNARLTLPAGLSDVHPTRLPTLRSGEELIVTARMNGERVSGELVLTGDIGGTTFEAREPFDLSASTAAGNRFVPSLWAAHEIESLEDDPEGGHEAKIIALSRAYSVMSRHTSLLVLESEAMFRAFGVDRNESNVAAWTGEDAAEEAEFQDDSDAASADDQVAQGSLGGLSGYGVGGGGRAIGAASSGAAPAMAERASRGRSADVFEGSAAQEPERESRAESVRREAAPPAPSASAAAPRMAPPADRAAPAERPSPSRVAANNPFVAQPPPAPSPPPSGRWMKRVYFRVGSVSAEGTPSFQEIERARAADEALRVSPDSRDRHRAAYRALSRAGQLERAMEIVEAWFARDRMDPEALIARADLLGRMGRRDEAVRVLSGVLDVRPEEIAHLERLSKAFERAGDTGKACDASVSLAELHLDALRVRGSSSAGSRSSSNSIAADLGLALRCARTQGTGEWADTITRAVSSSALRSEIERFAAKSPRTTTQGEVQIDATWSGGSDLDLTMIAPDGARLSWLGGRTTLYGSDAKSIGREMLGLRTATVGSYRIELTRADVSSHARVTGQLRVRALDETRTIPFVIERGIARVDAARISVRRESRLESSW